MTPFGSTHLPNEDYDKVKDFSQDQKATNKIWFIHEMAHVWQYQLGLNTAMRGIEIGIRGGYSDAKAYDYDLVCDDQGKEFHQFYIIKMLCKNLPLKNVLKEFLVIPSDKALLSQNYGGIYYNHEPKRY